MDSLTSSPYKKRLQKETNMENTTFSNKVHSSQGYQKVFSESYQTSTPLTSNKLSCSTDCWKVFSDLWVFLVPPRGKLSSMVAMFESPKNNAKSISEM